MLTKQRQTSLIQVCAEQREAANELWGIVLWCLLVGKSWGLAQAYLWDFHVLNDFMHFVVILVLRRKHECSCHDSLIDTRFLFFFYHVQFTVLMRQLSFAVFRGVGQSYCFISNRDERNPLLRHLLKLWGLHTPRAQSLQDGLQSHLWSSDQHSSKAVISLIAILVPWGQSLVSHMCCRQRLRAGDAGAAQKSSGNFRDLGKTEKSSRQGRVTCWDCSCDKNRKNECFCILQASCHCRFCLTIQW